MEFDPDVLSSVVAREPCFGPRLRQDLSVSTPHLGVTVRQPCLECLNRKNADPIFDGRLWLLMDDDGLRPDEDEGELAVELFQVEAQRSGRGMRMRTAVPGCAPLTLERRFGFVEAE